MVFTGIIVSALLYNFTLHMQRPLRLSFITPLTIKLVLFSTVQILTTAISAFPINCINPPSMGWCVGVNNLWFPVVLECWEGERRFRAGLVVGRARFFGRGHCLKGSGF